MDECQQWIKYKSQYGYLTKSMFFETEHIEHGTDNSFSILWHCADIVGKSFQHKEDRVIENINLVVDNFQSLKPLVDKLHVYMCPKPSANTSNACACKYYICYFARSTQIPHCMTDYITGHELGHVLQDSLCPTYRNNDKFKEYLKLRNAPTFLDDEDNEELFLFIDGRYANSNGYDDYKKYHGDWDTSPEEWFAEDFRYLFGIDTGDPYWGMPIDPPDERIREFMLSL